jgi:hypothetical protein
VALVTPLSYLALWAHLRRRQPAAVPEIGPPRPVVVVLSSIRWGYLWQRHQSLALAANGQAAVVFVESQPRRLRQLVGGPLRLVRQRGEAAAATPTPAGLRLVPPSPLAVLRPRAWARRHADRILAQAGDHPVSVILYAPSPAYLHLAARLADRGARVTYDAVIDWELAPAHFHPPRAVRAAEQALPADWRVVSDNPLLAQSLTARLGRSVAVIPPAADDAFLRHPWRALAEREPVIGWFGSIHAELDVELLCRLARAGVRVETVGPAEDAAVAAQLTAAGVIMRPAQPIDLLPARIDHWRVTLLAYRGPRAGTITPAKLLNALVGFQVAIRGIAVPPQVAEAVVQLPDSDEAAVEQLRELVADPGERAQLTPDQLSWQARLADITEAVQ